MPVKRYTLGTHRARSPEETWSRIEEILPRLGITRLADVTALDRVGIPVYQAIRPGSRNLSVSQGKAVTAAGARVSAAMEAIELWHAESLGSLPRVTSTLREMEFANPIPATSLPWRSDTRRLDAAPLEWVEMASLTGGRSGWLPRTVVEIDFMLPRPFEPRMFHVTSNGLASGNCDEEAQLHAVCEVIERHGLYLARADDTSGPRHGTAWEAAIDPDSVDFEPGRTLVRRFRDAGMKLALYDLTWELGVPIVAADVVAPDLPNVWRGCGCHPSPEVALCRALTEAAQSRLTYIAGARDDLTRFRSVRHPGETFDAFREPEPSRRFEALPDLAGRRVEDDLEEVLERLVRAGLVAYAVDLSRDDVGIPVTFAFIPGFKEAAYG